MSYKSFGEFLGRARIANKMSMKELAEKLMISTPYLCDVEKDRRYPFDKEKLDRLKEILKLDAAETDEMYDLARRGDDSVAPDLPQYVNHPYVSVALRKARSMNASENEWSDFIRQLEERRKNGLS